MANEKCKLKEKQPSSENNLLKFFLKQSVVSFFSSLIKSLMAELNKFLIFIMKILHSVEKLLNSSLIFSYEVSGFLLVLIAGLILLAFYLNIYIALFFLVIGFCFLFWFWTLNKKHTNEESQKTLTNRLIKSFLKKTANNLLSNLTKTFMQEINDVLMKKIKSLERIILIGFISRLLGILGVVFIIASGFILLVYYLKIHLAWGFLAIGISLMVWSWLLNKKHE